MRKALGSRRLTFAQGCLHGCPVPMIQVEVWVETSRRVKYGGRAGRARREFEQSCRRLEKQTSIYLNH